jgi:hypothetical protein
MKKRIPKVRIISTKDASILAALALFARGESKNAKHIALTNRLDTASSKFIASRIAKPGGSSAGRGKSEVTAQGMKTWASHQVRRKR